MICRPDRQIFAQVAFQHVCPMIAWRKVFSGSTARTTSHLELTDFMIDHNCLPGTDCLVVTMPLIVQISMIAWLYGALLWPIAIWNLGGGWILRKIQMSGSTKV